MSGPPVDVRRAYRAYRRCLERACEAALVGGCGVLVDRSTVPWTAEVSVAVPFGEVHYLPMTGAPR